MYFLKLHIKLIAYGYFSLWSWNKYHCIQNNDTNGAMHVLLHNQIVPNATTAEIYKNSILPGWVASGLIVAMLHSYLCE